MANDVVFTVEGKGKNLKGTAKDAGDIGKNVDASNAALDRAGSKQDAYNRREKGIFQTNLSSGKAYSKLAQNIGGGGSSSLVGAYATLAANVFALTAAFNALRSAAQFEQLVEGLNAVGDAAGRNLGHLGQRLREVTDNAISAERALKAVAIGTSAGFSAEQLEKLTTVAKGASLALGRNMEDAMDRLTRGAAKLEPEILDELGIMVRLDDATEAYATTLGKTAADLTQYERRMAFINAINEQGIQKFGDIANSVDPVPYDQLAASLDGLLKSLLSVINIGLRPLIDFMANSTAGLTGGLVLFASTITRQMAPALHNIAGNAREAAKQFHEMQGNVRQSIVTTGPLPAIYEKLSGKIKDGSASVAELAEAEKSLSDSMGQRIAKQAKMEEGSDNYKKSQAGIDNITLAQDRLTQVMQGRLGVQARVDAADSLTLAKFGTMREGWQGLNSAIELNNRDIDLNTDMNDKHAAKSAKWSKAAFKYGSRIKFVGAAFVNAIPFIGIAITAIGILTTLYDKFKPRDKLKEAGEEALKAFDRLEEINETLLRTISKTNDELDKMKAKYIALGGVINTVRDVIGELGQSILKNQSDALDRAIDKQLELQNLVDNFDPNAGQTTLGMSSQAGAGLAPATRSLEDYQAQLKAAREEVARLGDSFGKLSEGEAAAMNLRLQESILKAEQVSKAQGGLGKTILAEMATITFESGESIVEANIKLQKATNSLNGYTDSLQNAANMTAEFVKAQVALTAKATTPYDDIIDRLSAMQQLFKPLDELQKTERQPLDNSAVLEKEIDTRKRLAANIIKQLKLVEVLGISTEEEFNKFVDETEQRVAFMQKYNGQLKLLKNQEKETIRLAKSAAVGQAQALKMRMRATENVRKIEEQLTRTTILQNEELNRGLKVKLAEVELALQANKEDEELLKKRDALQKRFNDNTSANVGLRSELEEITARELDFLEKHLQVFVAMNEEEIERLNRKKEALDIEKRIVDALGQQARNTVQLANLNDKRRVREENTDIDPQQELMLFMKLETRRRGLINTEARIKTNLIKQEFILLKAKANLEIRQSQLALARIEKELGANHQMVIAQRQEHQEFVDAQKQFVDAMEPMIEQRIRLTELERKNSNAALDIEKRKLQIAQKIHKTRTAFEQGSGTVSKGLNDATRGMAGFVAGMRATSRAALTQEKDARQARQDAMEARKKNLTPGLDPNEGLGFRLVQDAGQQAYDDAGGGQGMCGEGLTEKIKGFRQSIGQLMEGMKQLGPEGELAYAVGQGALMVSESWGAAIDVFEEGGTKAERGAAIAAGVASTIAATANIMNRASAARIAAIDKEIAAEQKRDGKSKQSQAKIKALQAKKDQMGRKAFEQNKKMMMAQTVANTAAGMMSVWPDPTAPFFPMKIALAALIGAMGAAQLAIIAGTSYSGGGSASSSVPSAPTNINMGSRSNKVDISGGRANTAGEIGYLRGARGSGTSAADFRPAFAGRKYRAAGGAAYVVGEQGPELFVPSVPGRVVSNDDMEAGASAGTVNFTINAIDAAGVEEVLVEQRGNIIGMLRESANEYGTGFLEEVNEDAYTSTTEGSVYGRA